MNLKIIFVLIVSFISISGNAIISPFNHKEVKNNESYEFIVSGHFYGSGANKTGYPVNSILANINFIDKGENSFIMCLGDLFMDISNDIPFYKQSLFSVLQTPLLNSVGNHDLTKDIYEKNYGETFYSFKLGSDIHLVLNSELSDGSIKNEQLDLLKSVCNQIENGNISNLFIYSHRTIWAKHFNELDLLFKDNTQSILNNNFSSIVLPLLSTIKNKAKVFWFSGSMGDAPASFFYFNPDSITFIATAVRGLKRDALLKVKVQNGETSFETIPLTSQKIEGLKFYNVEFWNKNQGKEPFNYRLLPLHIKNGVLNKLFWIGLSIGVIVCLTFFYFKRKN